ncbi:DUF3958 family protein [Listeria booriae]|uniref:Uncharacterized protein n=1 Tax=Listeria booriae TaxID=1552123 RepID=A0A099WFE0_9LIST|nr:DUF3958 family protein [Listeria booriae]KGL42835.1 hypothetical protein EP57_05090 [Listeria booriae]MBC1891487.1 DUF3958 family protein [Listeria booriae]MBC1906334.1 DUF3958 family protein [Listeria booriae]STY41181.1 Uncharacterised protein [Listeria booriae]
MELRSEQIHQTLQQLKRKTEQQEDELYAIRQRQIQLEYTGTELRHIEREKENLIAQAHDVWRGNHGKSVAFHAEDTAHESWRKLRRHIENTREQLKQEQKTIQSSLSQMEEERKLLHKELVL